MVAKKNLENAARLMMWSHLWVWRQK